MTPIERMKGQPQRLNTEATEATEKATHAAGIHDEVCWDYADAADERATAWSWRANLAEADKHLRLLNTETHGSHGGHGNINGDPLRFARVGGIPLVSGLS